MLHFCDCQRDHIPHVGEVISPHGKVTRQWHFHTHVVHISDAERRRPRRGARQRANVYKQHCRPCGYCCVCGSAHNSGCSKPAADAGRSSASAASCSSGRQFDEQHIHCCTCGDAGVSVGGPAVPRPCAAAAELRTFHFVSSSAVPCHARRNKCIAIGG